MPQDFDAILRTYGFTIVGVFNAVPNLIVCFLMFRNQRMRKDYGILILALFLNGICGVLVAATGIQRFIMTGLKTDSILVSSRVCFYESVALLTIYINLAVSSTLLANSMDRLIIVTFPMYYIPKQSKIILGLNISALAMPFIIVAAVSVVELCLPARKIALICKTQQLFTDPAYTYIAVIRTMFACASIVIMISVVFLMKRRRRRMSTFGTLFSGGSFKVEINRKQNRYTISTVFSNVCTLALYVTPIFYQFGAELAGVAYIEKVKLYALVASYINGLNIVVTFLLRHDDIRRCVLSGMHINIAAATTKSMLTTKMGTSMASKT